MQTMIAFIKCTDVWLISKSSNSYVLWEKWIKIICVEMSSLKLLFEGVLEIHKMSDFLMHMCR